MRIERENVLLRVFLTSLEKAGSLPAYEAFVREAERAGCRGATVLRGEEGLAAGGRRLRPRPFAVAEEAPVVVEVVDTPGRIAGLLRRAALLLRGRIATTERAAVLVHRRKDAGGAGPGPADPGPSGRPEEGPMPRKQPGVLIRVYLSEAERYGGRSLAREILDRAAAAGADLALVLKSPAGFGAGHGERSVKSEVASMGQPLVVEIAAAEEVANSVLPLIEQVIEEGLVTVEKVTMLRFGS